MSGRGIHIIFSPEGEPRVFFEADNDKETELLQGWLRQNFIGARSPDPCGSALTTSGAPSPSGGDNEERHSE